MSESIVAFDFQPRTRIVFGAGRVAELGRLASEFAARRVLLVTDRTLVALGHAERGRESLARAGIEVALFDGVRENPDTDDVARCLEAARAARIDGFVGLGGGSSLDTAKACNFLLTNGGRMEDYWGRGKATQPMLPLIAVPTTAGTGSECQSFTLVADARSHRKMACGDPKAAPRVALLDPELTATQPRQVTADTGIDTLVHALESAVTTARNEVSSLFARRAFALAVASLPRVLDEPGDLAARGAMQLAAAYAGLAIEHSMLGAAHSAANPLTARHGVVHGRAVALMVPAVIRHNAVDPAIARLYAELAIEARIVAAGENVERVVGALLDAVERILDHAGMPRRLADLGIDPTGIPALAADAADQWTARFNPRPVDVADFTSLYRSLLAPGPARGRA